MLGSLFGGSVPDKQKKDPDVKDPSVSIGTKGSFTLGTELFLDMSIHLI